MPVPPYWPVALPQFPRRDSWTGGPQDSRVQFQPSYGPPLQRARTTADPETWDGIFRNLKQADLLVLRAFVADDLARGTLAYSWRDPVFGDAALWRILGDGQRLYALTARGANLHDATLRLMRLPGSPWWGPYLRPAASRVPDVVADWDAGVYGIAGAKVAASALPLVAGTFDVYSTSTSDVETVALAQVITAGGIPATAPGSVKRRVYFAT
jgi:hypothetical protein